MRAWTQQEAIELCILIESKAPEHGCHVALTGGLLYKAGARTDCDVVLYRIRQVEAIDVIGLKGSLNRLGVTIGVDFSWGFKANYEGKKIDFFLPETTSDGQEYP